MKQLNKIIAFVLIMAVAITTTNLKIFAEDAENETVMYNDREYEIVEENKEEITLVTEEDNYVYECTTDPESNKMDIVCEEAGIFFDKEVYDYSVEVINFNEESNILEYNLINNETGEVTHVSDSDIQAQLPVMGGIAIGEIVYALLCAGATIFVIAGVKYVAVSISKMKKQSHTIYAAALSGGKIGIGPALTYSEAAKYANVNKNSSTIGIFCVGPNAKSNACSIAKQASPMKRVVHDEKHDNQDGYYYHYHPARYATGNRHLGFHAWYYTW